MGDIRWHGPKKVGKHWRRRSKKTFFSLTFILNSCFRQNSHRVVQRKTKKKFTNLCRLSSVQRGGERGDGPGHPR